jgi:serine/threonine protein kinase
MQLRGYRVGRYVAIKISRADTTALGKELKIHQDLADYAQKFQTKTQSTIDTNSGPIVQLLGHFIHKGPNGSHLCLLFEPMGATANTMLEQMRGPGYYKSPIPLWLAKSLAKQLLLGLDFLHSCGIAHGDVQPGNLLFAAKDLNDPDEKILTQAEDELSISKPIQRKDGKADKWAPRYLCSTKSLAEYVALDEHVVIKLSDLGAGECVCRTQSSPFVSNN